jgi:RNA polymerase sigma factor (sigma-70 family)
MRLKQFERVIEEHRPRLLKVAENLVGEHAAKDVVQTTLLSVHESRDWQHMSVGEFKKWLTRAVQNDSKNYLEAQERAHDHEAGFAARLPVDESERDDAIDVRRAVAKLPEEIRAAVMAVVVEGLTVREHGAEAGVSHDTAARRVQQGLAMLRAGLTEGRAARLQESRDEQKGARDGA